MTADATYILLFVTTLTGIVYRSYLNEQKDFVHPYLKHGHTQYFWLLILARTDVNHVLSGLNQLEGIDMSS